jgi:DeoR/GlpR family transcriptional regulator of sugar metabolism
MTGHSASARTKWSARLDTEIPALYEAGKLTVVEIANLLNVKPRTVRARLSAKPYEHRIRDAKILHGRGWVLGAIADALNVSDETVRRYLRTES